MKTRIAYLNADEVDCFLDGSLVTKDLSLSWSQGNGGGLDTGSLAANSTYHGHIINDGTDNDVLWSTAPVNPAVPGGWALTGQVVGSVLTNALGEIRNFMQIADEFWLYGTDGGAITVLNSAGNSGSNLRDLVKMNASDPAVPFGAKVECIFYSDFKHGSNTQGWGWMCDPDLPFQKGQTAAFKYQRVQGWPGIGSETRCWTNASAQIWTGDTASGAVLTLIVKGWRDPRVVYQ